MSRVRNETVTTQVDITCFIDYKEMGVPARVPGAFVVDLLEDTGRFDRGEAELLLSWVEVEVRGVPDLLEGLCRLRGAVMKAAAVV